MIHSPTIRPTLAHRWAWLLACATFPLIWVGGLVTTTDAGMAFRDWLTSDGQFFLFYDWLNSAGDKFVEHGHRLLGAAVGILTIGLVFFVWRGESRSWIRWFSLVLLAGVIVQGILGGMRVVLDERTLALVHGCTGPLFFACCVAMVVFTSRWWQDAKAAPSAHRRGVFRLAAICTGLAYLQLIVGAVVRHSPHMTSASAAALFQTAVYFHLLLAVLIVGYVLVLSLRCLWSGTHMLLALSLAGLMIVQIALGASTWLVKYGVPRWAASTFGEITFVNREADMLQASIITGHVAVGSLLLACSLVLALRCAREARIGLPAVFVKSQSRTEVVL